MTFKYDQSKFNEYRKDLILTENLPSYSVIIPFLLMDYMQNKNDENILFSILIKLFILIFILLIYTIIGYTAKVIKRGFYSFIIECNEKSIIISSTYLNYEIKNDQIKKIFKDNKNNFYIVTNKNKRREIIHFIENIDEFENYLSSIMSIKQYNNKYKLFQYSPIILFNGFLFSFALGNYFLGIAFLFIILIIVVYYIIISV